MVGQGKAGPRGIARNFRVQIDADLVIAQSAQQPGKDGLSLGRQTLPVGGVVAGRLGPQILWLPIRQHVAQGTFRLVLALGAVQGFKAAFQRCGRIAVQLAQQHGLPVVPGGRPHAANVADGQHRQQIQPFPGFHGLCKIAHCAQIAEIALLGNVRHQQMIAHQPFDRFRLFGGQAKAGRHAPGNLGTQDGMVLGAALAHVMQEQGHVQDAPVHAIGQDPAGDGQLFDQLAAFDLGQCADALDRMFVNRVVVVDVELHHRDDGFEFGNEGPQNTQFVHASQGPFRIAVLKQQVKKDLHRLGIRPHLVVDPVQIGRDQPHRVGVKKIAGPQGFFEDAQQVQLVGNEV